MEKPATVSLIVIFFPIILLLLYPFIAYFFWLWCLIRARPGIHRFTVGIVVAVILILIPGWDLIFSSLYLRYLCSTEGGFKIYKTVSLPRKYFREDGIPTFITKRGEFDDSVIGSQFIMKSTHSSIPPRYFDMEKRSISIIDRETETILGEFISFSGGRSWVFKWTLGSEGGGCELPPDMVYPLIRGIFTVGNEGGEVIHDG